MTAAPLLHIADLVLNRPLLLTPDKALVIADVLAGRIGIEAPAMVPEASRFYGRRERRPDGGDSFLRVDEGVAIITIDGSLVNRGAWIGASSGLTSYEGLSAQLTEVAQRDDVKALILDVNSPGGEASGVVTLGRQIRALRVRKRVVAVVNDTACSAAYWIASQANEIVVSETSSVGSIGALVLHIDRSGELAQKGVVPTVIHAGAHKVDGHPFAALPVEVRADWQAQLENLVGLFAREVAAGRGDKLTAAAARATEARVLYGRAAVKAGLADRVGTFEAELAAAKPPKPAQKPAKDAPAPQAAEAISPAAAAPASASRPPPPNPWNSATTAEPDKTGKADKTIKAAETPAQAQARRDRVVARLNRDRHPVTRRPE